MNLDLISQRNHRINMREIFENENRKKLKLKLKIDSNYDLKMKYKAIRR